MAETYASLIAQAAPRQAAGIRHDHYVWFKNYKSTCNAPTMSPSGMAICISSNLKNEAERLSAIRVDSSTGSETSVASGNFLEQLEALDVKSSVLEEIKADRIQGEGVVGYVELDAKRKIIFTNARIISVSVIPLVGMNTEWSRSGGIVFQGGNFQIRSRDIASVTFAPTRIKKSEGALGVSKEITDFLNKFGPAFSKAIWPFELQLVSPESDVLNRFYGIRGSEAVEIARLAKRANFRIFVIEPEQ